MPLCGKSLDLVWLRDHQFEVVGVELSTEACDAFFSENRIPFTKVRVGDFDTYQTEGLTVFNGDFFQLSAAQLGKIDALYDRAALIALPESMRVQYAEHLKNLLAPSIENQNFQFLQIMLTRKPADEDGPPHSISSAEFKTLYGKTFSSKLISREEVEARAPAGSKTFESVILSHLVSICALFIFVL